MKKQDDKKVAPKPVQVNTNVTIHVSQDPLLGMDDNNMEFGIPRTWNEDDIPNPPHLVPPEPVHNSVRKSIKGQLQISGGTNAAQRKSLIPERKKSTVGQSHPNLTVARKSLTTGRKSLVPVPTGRKSFQPITASHKNVHDNHTEHRRQSTLLQDPQYEDFIVDMKPTPDVRIDFHEHEVLMSLKVLEDTSRVFFQKHKHNPKRLDLLDEKGNLIYQLVDFSTPDLDFINEINYCLMGADGKKQLLIIQGDSGFLGLNGEIIVRYPGSLPGDQELIYGSITQKTQICSLKTKYLIKNSEGNIIFELVDMNKNCIFSPLRKYSQSFFEMKKPKGLPTVFGRIEERTLVNETDVMSTANLVQSQPSNKSQPSEKRISTSSNKSIGNKPSAIVDNRSRRTSIQGKRRKSLNTEKPSVTKNKSHTNFCIGYMNKLDYQTRGLLIAAHILLNYDHVGKKKCTQYCFGVGLLIALMVVIIGGGAALVITVAKFY